MKSYTTVITIMGVIIASLIIRLVAIEYHYKQNKSFSENGNLKNSSNQLGKTWTLVYENDKDGRRVVGSKKGLMNAIKKGSPVRVGWLSRRRKDTTKSVQHLIDATFITIANNEEVFAQIKPFMGQRPDLNSDTLSMTLMPNEVHWVLGTNGTISSLNKDLVTDEVSKNSPSQFRYNISWYSKNN